MLSEWKKKTRRGPSAIASVLLRYRDANRSQAVRSTWSPLEHEIPHTYVVNMRGECLEQEAVR